MSQKEIFELDVVSNLNKLTADFAKSRDTIKQVVDTVRNLNTSLEKTGLEKVNLQEVGRALNQLGKGSINNQLTISMARTLEQAKKAVEYQKSLSAAQEVDLRRGVKAYDIEKLKLAVKGQQLILAKAESDAMERNSENSRKTMMREKAKLTFLQEELRNRNLIAQQQDKQLKQQIASFAKLSDLTKSSFTQAAGNYDSSYMSGLLARNRDQGKLSKAVGRQDLEFAMAQSNTVDLRSLSQEQLKLQLLAQQTLVNQAKYALNTRYTEENLRQLQTEEKKKQAVIDQIAANKENAAVQKKSKADSERALKQGYDSKSDIAKMNAKANDPTYLATRQNLRMKELFGDGGAGLFKIQAGLLANYTLMNSFFSMLSFGRQFVVELDASLRDLQAITATTEGNMEGLRQKLIEVSKGTKFTAVEISNAAKIMGQAGLSTQQIKDSIEGVTLYATATGSSLEEAADTATSVISIFKLRAEDMTHVANVMTEAINRSKLTTEKLALGMQYAGNIAAESGLTFEETTAVLGAMSNAGIKSGSTLGTGLRQVLIEMQNPTEKFIKNLKAVGLGVEDVDVRSKGFVGVMRTLRDAGFDTTRAFESFEVRSAAAFAAIQNSPEMITNLQEAFLHSNAAMEANATQMKSLANSTSKLQNNFGLIINQVSGPLTKSLIVVFDALSNVLSATSGWSAALSIIGTLLLSGGTVLAVTKLGSLISNLAKGMFSLKVATFALNGAMITTAGTSGGLGMFRAAMALSPVGAWTLGISAAIGVLGLFASSTSEAEAAMESARTALQNSQGDYDKLATNTETVGEALETITDRFSELEKHPEDLRIEIIGLQNRFSELGFELKNGLKSSINEVIDSLVALQAKLNTMSAAQLEQVIITMDQLAKAQAKTEAEKNYTTIGMSGNLGVSRELQNMQRTKRYGDITGVATLYKTTMTKANSVNLMDTKQADESYNNLLNVQEKLRNLRTTLYSESKKLEKNTDQKSKNISQAMAGVQENIDGMLAGVTTALANVSGIANAGRTKLQQDAKASVIGQAVTETLTKDKTELNKIKGSLDSNASVKEKEETIKKLQAQYDALLPNVLKAVRLKLTNEVGQAGVQILKSLGIDINSDKALGEFIVKNSPEIAAQQSAITDQIDDTKKGLDNAASSAASAAKTVFEKAAESLSALSEVFSDTSKVFDDQKGILQNLIDANSNPHSGGYGKYSDAEIYNMQRMQYNTDLAKIQNRRQQLPQLISKADSVIMANGGAGTGVNAEGYRSYTSSNKDLNGLIKQRNEYVRESNQLQAEYNALTGQSVVENLSITKQIGVTIDAYRKQMDVESQWSFNIKENLTSTFKEAGASFAEMTRNIVTGSMSAGEAIRGFATSVLESMLQIATNKLAWQLMGLAFGAFSPSGTVSTDSYIDSAAMGADFFGLSAATGGYVHMAGGGAVATRDSVPALLRPGEFVMRNQAVEAIGRQNLETMNALGARYISQSSASNDSGVKPQQGGPTVLNVYVVSQDQKPSLTKNDVIVTITDDMVKGGSTKKLIKSIMAGA